MFLTGMLLGCFNDQTARCHISFFVIIQHIVSAGINLSFKSCLNHKCHFSFCICLYNLLTAFCSIGIYRIIVDLLYTGIPFFGAVRSRYSHLCIFHKIITIIRLCIRNTSICFFISCCFHINA